MKVWESPFIPSHLTFKKFRIHSLSDNQSNNQSNLSIYYNIPKFRILGCYKPTTLKMNLALEIRRGQKEIGQVRGLLKIHRSSPGSWVLPPLEAWLWFPRNSYTSSILLIVSVFLDLRENSFSGLFQQWHNLFLNSCIHLILVKLFHDRVFLADGSGANTKQLSISHGGHQTI